MLGIFVLVVILAILVLVFARNLLEVLFSLLNLLFERTGRIALGTLLLVGGLIFAVTSHTAAYQQLTDTEGTAISLHMVSFDQNNGDVYLQDSNHTTSFYIIHEADFSPTVQSFMFQLNGGFTSLIYDSSQGRQVTLADSINGGTGYTVEQFTLLDFLGMSQYSFTSATYREHPEGLYQNHWPLGGSIAAIGLLLLLFTSWLPRLISSQAKSSASGTASGLQPPYKPDLTPEKESPQGDPPATTPPNPYTDQLAQQPEASEENSKEII